MDYSSLPSGHRVAGRFQIEAPIGRGRSSTVYRALDPETRSHVALKVLDPFLAQDPVNLERFSREVRIIRQLDHPNVVRLYSFFRDAGLYVIAMEYVDGMDLAAWLARYGRFEVEAFLTAAKAMADAVGACHKVGVFHRDLKPSNVLISSDQAIKLVDFGVSKVNTMSDLTKTGTVIGTPAYMAPEQFSSKTADPRSDLYSLGVVFYELLSGRPPYAGTSLTGIFQQHVTGLVAPLSEVRADVPEWLEAIVRKCLAIDRNRRYQSAYELSRDLEKANFGLAHFESGRRPETCRRCQAVKVAGLPFCHQCTTVSVDEFERGRHGLVLYKCDEPDVLSEHLAGSFQLEDRQAVRERLDQLPVLLVWGVSERTAVALAGDLGGVPCELAVVEKLPRQLQLPKIYLVYACLPMLPALWLRERVSAAAAVAMIVLSELAVVWLYRRKIRPLISLGRLKEHGETGPDPFAAALARQFRKLQTGDLKALLGRIVASYLAIRKARSATAAAVDVKGLSRLIEQAIRTGVEVEGYEIYLESRSLNDIKQKIEAADMKLRLAGTAEQIEPLVEVKTRLQADFQRYLELQELHARLFSGLLNLNAALRALADAVSERRVAPEVDAELERLEAGLTVESAPATATG